VTPNGGCTVHVGGTSADTPLEETVELHFDDTEAASGDVTDSTVSEGD
jgi:hypothetical protein